MLKRNGIQTPEVDAFFEDFARSQVATRQT